MSYANVAGNRAVMIGAALGMVLTDSGSFSGSTGLTLAENRGDEGESY